ncbi:MAG: hypothetical protein U1E14_20870 [Geminicoccaceae bacterium]
MHRSQPAAAAGAARSDAAPITLVRRVVATTLRLLRDVRRAGAGRRELHRMGEHMLRDVGLGRDGAEKAWFD